MSKLFFQKILEEKSKRELDRKNEEKFRKKYTSTLQNLLETPKIYVENSEEKLRCVGCSEILYSEKQSCKKCEIDIENL